jgi:RHS repeat-associated protein
MQVLAGALMAVLAIAAICASAAPAAVWTIEGKTLAELGLKEESITSTAVPFTIEVPKLSLKVECEAEKGSGKIFSPSTDEATMELSKCKVVESKVCTVTEPIVIKAKTELIKKAGIVYDVLTAKEAEQLGVLKLKGEACAFPLELKLKGSTAGQLGLEEMVKQPLKFAKATAEAAGTSMLAGTSPAFFVATSNRQLSGVHAGGKWGACATCGLFSFVAEEGYGAGNSAEPDLAPSFAGDQINVASGNLVQTQTDLAVEGRGPALELTRSYNSQLAAAAKAPGTFGYGWIGTYGASLTINEAAETATVRQANGSTAVFDLVEGKYVAAPWVQAKLVKEGTNYIYTLPNQLKLLFNSTGQLTKETDRHGNAITLAYNAKSQLETATTSAGRKLTFAYNAEGQVESVKDPMGRTVKYAYESGNLSKVTLPGEIEPTWKFKYDASHQLTEKTDGRGHTIVTEYDGSNRAKSQKDPLERKLSLEYAETGGIKETTIVEPNASKTLEKFNKGNEATEVTRALGTEIAQTSKFEYDSSFNLIKLTDPGSHATVYGYDGEGNRTSEKDANENKAEWAYNSTHDLTKETTPKGETTTITRNAAGDPELIKRPAPGATTQETKFEWAENGDLKMETDPLGHKTSFEYDTFGDRKTEVDPEEDKTTWTYNEDGESVTEVSPRGNEVGAKATEFETKTERDSQGRPIKVTDPLGHETKYKYDAAGNLEALTNSNLHATTYVYDADNERTEVKAANGNTAKTGYDSMGQIKSKTDGNAHTTKYERNALEQISEEIDPLERKTTRKYDAAGNLKELKDPEGRTTTYSYDPGNRLKEVSYSDLTTKPVSYEYNKDGDATIVKDATGTTTNTYDELDRLTESKNGNAEVVKYEYNLGNQAIKITYPNAKSITQGFDLAGRLGKVTDWLGNETKFSYNRNSMPKTTTFPATSTNKDEYEYNQADQLTKTTTLKGAETLASLVYARDNAAQLKSATQKGLPGIEKPEYGYDERERMTSGAGSSFEYDAANNPTKVAAATFSYDVANQLKEGGGNKYTFNNMGQRAKATPTTGPATTYGYDQAGNLISVKRPEEGKTTKIEDSYAYDGTGLRASQTINGTTTHMAWDTADALPLLLYDGANYYLYGPEGLPFEQITSETATYLHHDQQGSTRLLTNAAGETKGAYTYTPYGATEGHTGTATTPLGYDSEYRSEDTGLIYLRKRAYDPTTAQFISVDPLVMETGEAYGYAGQSPVNAGDPSGLCWCEGGGQPPPPSLTPGQSLLQWLDSVTYAMGPSPFPIAPPVPFSVYPDWISDQNYFGLSPLPPYEPPVGPPEMPRITFEPPWTYDPNAARPNWPSPMATPSFVLPPWLRTGEAGALGGHQIMGGNVGPVNFYIEGNYRFRDIHHPIHTGSGFIGVVLEIPLPVVFPRPRR